MCRPVSSYRIAFFLIRRLTGGAACGNVPPSGQRLARLVMAKSIIVSKIDSKPGRLA